MKVYKFFRIPDDDEKEEYDLERKYTLYAITNNKDFAERFKDDRNMKKFICKVNKGIEKEEYIEMANENRGAVLEIHSLVTALDDNHTIKNSCEKDVLMTYSEYQIIKDIDTPLDDDTVWRSMPFPLVFKQKYRKLLESLQIINYYKLMSVDFLPLHLAEKLSENDDYDGYSAPALTNDELAIFIKTIRDTL